MAASNKDTEWIPPGELERYRDAEWALHDPGIKQAYEGQWVVAYERRIITHGLDPDEVLAKANQFVKDQRHLLVFCMPDDPELWLQD